MSSSSRSSVAVVFIGLVLLTNNVYGDQSLAGNVERPNILLILADDLGFADLGCYGSEIATPNLDRLATNGLRFRQFYNCTRCCPSRACLLTGLYPHQAGVGEMTNNRQHPGYFGFPQPNTVTIAEVLKSAGYHTSMVGKWHLSAGPKTPRPTDRGFDEFYGMIGGFNSCFDETPYYSRLPADRTKRVYSNDNFYSSDAFGDYSLDFIKLAREAKKPFFQYLAFNAPHFPLHAKKSDIAKYQDRYACGWDKLRSERHVRQLALNMFPAGTPLSPRSGYKTRQDFFRTGENPVWDSLPPDRQLDLARRMAIFAAMVDCMDQNIGRIIYELEKIGELDRTLILFMSDNGACAEWDPFGFDKSSGPTNILFSKERLDEMGGPTTYHSYGSGWANAGSTPFRNYKHDTNEGGIRTPLIVHWPKGIADKGAWRDQVGHLIDIMATCVAVSGASYPKEFKERAITPMEGVSLLPAFANQPITRPGNMLAWEHEGNRAIRVGDMKLVGPESKPWELYDLRGDPIELHNLADQSPETVERLADQWNTWAKRCQVIPKPKPMGKKANKKS